MKTSKQYSELEGCSISIPAGIFGGVKIFDCLAPPGAVNGMPPLYWKAISNRYPSIVARSQSRDFAHAAVLALERWLEASR